MAIIEHKTFYTIFSLEVVCYSQLFGEEDGEEDISPCTDDPGISGNTAVKEPPSKPAGIRTAWRGPSSTPSDKGHTDAVIVGHTERKSIRQWAEQAGYSPHALFTKVFIPGRATVHIHYLLKVFIPGRATVHIHYLLRYLFPGGLQSTYIIVQSTYIIYTYIIY